MAIVKNSKLTVVGAGGLGRTVADTAELVGMWASIQFVDDRPGHDRRYAIDAGKIRSELGWTPAHDIASGMASTVAWYLQHLQWCGVVTSGNYERQRLGLAN